MPKKKAGMSVMSARHVMISHAEAEQGFTPLEVFGNSIGFYIGCKDAQGNIAKRSLYYENEDQAKSELEDGSWTKRLTIATVGG